jgi:hypothetical protein
LKSAGFEIEVERTAVFAGGDAVGRGGEEKRGGGEQNSKDQTSNFEP